MRSVSQNDESGRQHPDRQSRRSKGSSSDEDLPPETNGIIQEDLRAGGPRLCALPATTLTLHPNHHLVRQFLHRPVGGMAIRTEIFNLLSDRDVDYLTVE